VLCVSLTRSFAAHMADGRRRELPLLATDACPIGHMAGTSVPAVGVIYGLAAAL
jgi:hypothetical protein